MRRVLGLVAVRWVRCAGRRGCRRCGLPLGTPGACRTGRRTGRRDGRERPHNGPQLYAHEIYALRDGVPGTYQVILNVFPTSLDCTGTALAIPTATPETTARGNGQADAKFTPEDAMGFAG